MLEEAAPSLVPLRRRALEIALLLAEPGDRPPDAHAIGLAVLDVLRFLAERGPVVVAVDDAQWLDPASAGVLQIALRRLRDEHVGLLATLRRTPDVVTPFELDRSFPDDRLTRISLPARSGSRAQPARGTARIGPHPAGVCARAGGDSRQSLLRARAGTRARPHEHEAEPGPGLAVPESLQELLGGRLARLPGETLDVLLEVAALARPTVELVAAVEGDQERVLEALEAAVREAVVEFDDSRLRSAHPLLASICYERAPLWKRRAVHRAFAEAVSDVEERARHLALAADGPDAVVASYLDAAADHAAGRGPSRQRPSSVSSQPRPPGRSCPGATTAPARGRPSPSRGRHRVGDRDARATARGGSVWRRAGGRARCACRDVQGRLLDADRALGRGSRRGGRRRRALVAILGLRAWNHLLRNDVPSALVDARMALEKAERVGEPGLIAGAIARVGQVETWAAEVTPGLLERGADMEERLGLSLDYQVSPSFSLARLMIRLGEIERARAMFEELDRKAVARGDEGTRFLNLWSLSEIEWIAGNWRQAYDHAAAAQGFGERTMP